MFELTGKVAVITGAGRGIGRGIALELARSGAAVAVADRDLTLAQAVTAEIEALGLGAIAVEVDVGKQTSANECIAQVLERFSRLDIVVNNAGVFQKQLGFDEDEADFNRCLDINLTGIWRMVRAAIPQLKAQKNGRIINIASIGGRQGVDFAPAYCASKAAVINLTQSLAAALGADNITVNTVCPGSIDTAMQEEIKALREGTGARHEPESCPLSGPLTAADIGYAVVFFASEAARNITGQALNVDCGSIMS
jgi:meso-butanediol dehydrogenase/(S,S)-butanediol dehydrogenase/diacetyl reductase